MGVGSGDEGDGGGENEVLGRDAIDVEGTGRLKAGLVWHLRVDAIGLDVQRDGFRVHWEAGWGKIG